MFSYRGYCIVYIPTNYTYHSKLDKEIEQSFHPLSSFSIALSLEQIVLIETSCNSNSNNNNNNNNNDNNNNNNINNINNINNNSNNNNINKINNNNSNSKIDKNTISNKNIIIINLNLLP